jgi:hypothetical protein|tara:strand:- start:62 stop:445 length:384 start_codon:yes stop_codon:yes gene_type:complete
MLSKYWLKGKVMKKFIIVLFAMLIVFNASAQEKSPELVLDITIPCSNNGPKFMYDLTTAYKELPFAQGMFTIKPVRGPNFVTSQLYMYVSKDWKTFSIFSMTNVEGQPVACVLVGGEQLKPYRPKEN